MDTQFVFPRPAPAVPRPTPTVATTTPTSTSKTTSRESNALRASVLDVALELGIGNNSTVTNWMFSNSLAEEDEEDLRSPSLTHGSTETSEESSPGHFPWTPPAHHAQPTFPLIPPNPFAASASEAHIHFDKDVSERPARPAMGAGIPFPEPPRPTTPSRGKLRKKRADGYESDGGYISDAGKKKGKEKESGSDKKAKAKEAKERAKEEKLQEKRDKEEERKRKKSMGKTKKGEDKDGYATGYETDGASKSSKKGKSGAEVGYETDGSSKKKKTKGKSGDGGYETDSGYVSSTSTKGKSKKGFFGLKSKQSKADLRQEEIPPMPSIDKDPVTLPIASKFATAIDTGPLMTGESLNSMISKAMDAPTAAALAATSSPAPISQYPYQSTSPSYFSPNNRESLSSAESGGSMSATTGSSLSHSSKRRGFQFLGHDLGHGSGGGSSSTITPPTQVPLPPSAVSTPVSESQGSLPSPSPTSNVHGGSRGYAPSAGGSSPVQHSTSHSLNSPPSAFPPVQHSSSNSLTSPPSAFPPVHYASSNSLNSPPSALPPVQHSSSNSLNSPPSAFTPQVFPTARNPSLSRGVSITKSQLAQVATSQPASTPEPIVSPAPVPVVAPPVQPMRTPSTPSARTSPTTKTQPLRLSPPATQHARLSPTPTAAQPRLSPTGTTQPLRTRPRVTLAPSPVPSSPASYFRSPSPAPSNRPSLIIPSSDYIVPSPRASPLPSPNVLAYYDIPPPSPPPSGPLPKVPPPGSFSSPNRTRMQERSRTGSQGHIARSRTPEPNGPNSNIQRGRELPFPARPIMSQTATPSLGPGLEAAVKVPRYRELYGLPLPKETHNEAVQRREVDRARDWDKPRYEGEANRRPASDGSWVDHGGVAYDDEDEEDDMRDVLERFEDSRVSVQMNALQQDIYDGKALAGSPSFEAIRRRITDRYHGDSDSDYHDEANEDEGARKSSMEYDDETNSRWSGSIYSRVSVLDPEKSEEARQRFLKRVEDLYGNGEKEKVPPVPKIPDAFVDGSGRNWNRF